jgi:hypothetical protein
MYVLELKIIFLSVSTLEEEGYVVMFLDGKVLIWSEGVGTQDVVVRLGTKQGMLYRLLGQPLCGLMSMTKGD